MPTIDNWRALVERLQTEADLCRNEGAEDIAALMDEAVNGLQGLAAEVQALREDAERRAQAARHGLYEAVEYIRQKANDYAEIFGSRDPDTGAFEFKREAQQEYFQTLDELADEIEQLAARGIKGDAS